MKPMKTPTVELGDPIVMSRASPDEKRWGFWQGPSLERLTDGRIHATHCIQLDSATTYGFPRAHFLSSDEGRTWPEAKDADGLGPLLNRVARWPVVTCANGDLVRLIELPSIQTEGLNLPDPVSRSDSPEGPTVFYDEMDLPQDLRSRWYLARRKAGQAEWVEESIAVSMPGQLRFATEGVLAFPRMRSIRVAPDGTLWGRHNERRIVDGKAQAQTGVILLQSDDHGHTWHMQGEMLYEPDQQADPQWNERDGFSEPDYAFMKDGSAICLMRSEGPLYSSRSMDQGKTWSKPAIFDSLGVSPELLTLANGVTLAAYGRPGLYIRATADPEGLTWTDRTMVVEPGNAWENTTCAYASMMALDETTALIAYSHFRYPDAKGKLCKTILVRTVSVAGEGDG